MKKSRRTLIFAMIVAAALFPRLCRLWNSFEYDEIWTVTGYAVRSVPDIFRDLATPNNHPLHTLIVKWLLLFLPDNSVLLRLPALAAGLGTVILTFFVTRDLFRSKTAAYAAMILAAFNPVLADNSVLLRGYSLQVFLLLAFARCVQLSERRAAWMIPGAGAAALSMLTLSPSVLFAVPIGGIQILTRKWKKKSLAENLTILLSEGALGIFVLIWYLGNLEKFRHGQRFGHAMESAGGFLRFLEETFEGNTGTVVTAFFFLTALYAVLSGWKRREMLVPLTVVLFPLFASFLFLAGPPRVYQALIPFCAGGAGAGIALASARLFRKRKRIFTAALIFSLLAAATLRPEEKPDWGERFERILELPPGFCVFSGCCDSLALFWNNHDRAGAVAQRIDEFGDRPGSVYLQFDVPELNGYGENEGEDFFSPGIPGRKIADGNTKLYGWSVCGVSREAVKKSGVLLFKFRGMRQKDILGVRQFFLESGLVKKVLIPNFWISMKLMKPDGSVAFLAVCGLPASGGDPEELIRRAERIRGLSGIYTLAGLEIE